MPGDGAIRESEQVSRVVVETEEVRRARQPAIGSSSEGSRAPSSARGPGGWSLGRPSCTPRPPAGGDAVQRPARTQRLETPRCLATPTIAHGASARSARAAAACPRRADKGLDGSLRGPDAGREDAVDVAEEHHHIGLVDRAPQADVRKPARGLGGEPAEAGGEVQRADAPASRQPQRQGEVQQGDHRLDAGGEQPVDLTLVVVQAPSSQSGAPVPPSSAPSGPTRCPSGRSWPRAAVISAMSSSTRFQ